MDDALVFHDEAGSARRDLKRGHLAGRELIEDEVAAQRGTERGTRLVDEAGGAIRVVLQRRRDELGLRGMRGLPQAFAHPAALTFLILMAAAPAGIAALGDVHEALFLAGEVGVVVHAEHVAVIVEGDFLDVA